MEKQREDWEALAKFDPYWAILADGRKKFRKWNLDEFFQTGKQEIEYALRTAEGLSRPPRKQKALDFGCGVGRLTRALAPHFDSVIGVDISETMIATAKELNSSIPNCSFVVNLAQDLRQFSDSEFDLIYSALTLQHVPERKTIMAYVAEFLRLLTPYGVVIFQLPAYVPLVHRIQPRRRIYRLFKISRVPETLLLRRLGLHPMHYSYVPTVQVADTIVKNNGELLKTETGNYKGIRIVTYYAGLSQKSHS